MSWTRETIFKKVIEKADRFGCRNPQQFQQLKYRLSKSDPDEVFHGLFGVFSVQHVNSPQQQELAAKLLANASREVKVDVYELTRSVLCTIDYSIEELPWFFMDLIGKDEFLEVLNEISTKNLSARELRALDTWKYWASGYGLG